ncbi:MAG: four helix bundle protein [Verrucomicrobiae bacterium]|nr:four helix bundle protein [Verrucomicrobiae bacterium]
MQNQHEPQSAAKSPKPHRNLMAWQKAMDVVVLVYDLVRSLPSSELYGLSLQMRRAAVSAPSNIAEGAAGRSPDEFRRHLAIALGSLSELETQLEICSRLNFSTPEVCEKVSGLVNECMALTYGLRRSLAAQASPAKG